MISVPYGFEDESNKVDPHRKGAITPAVCCARCGSPSQLALIGDVFLCRGHGGKR